MYEKKDIAYRVKTLIQKDHQWDPKRHLVRKKFGDFYYQGARYSDPNYLELLPVLCKDQMQAEQKFVDSDEHTVAFPIDRVLEFKMVYV